MNNLKIKRESHWLSHGNMARSCGVSVEAFRAWRVRPVAKIGREVFYSVGDVTQNRMDNLVFGPNSKMTKFNPACSEYALERIAGLEARIVELEASGQ